MELCWNLRANACIRAWDDSCGLLCMFGLDVKKRKSRRRVRMLAATALCAAALFSGNALAQPVAYGSTAQDTTTDTPAVDLVAQRLNDSLSREMFGNFNLFIYIDKAERGPFGQRMFVFEKTGGNLA